MRTKDGDSRSLSQTTRFMSVPVVQPASADALDPPCTADCGDGNDEQIQKKPVSNVYVLNIAFCSFLAFMAAEVVFALIANSQSMLADSIAMMVDAFTYLLNLFAEWVKSRHEKECSQLPNKDPSKVDDATDIEKPVEGGLHDCPEGCNDDIHKRRRDLQLVGLELVPPTISVVALTVVTSLTLRDAAVTIISEDQAKSTATVNLTIMLIFSAANLLLDLVNVCCFSRTNLNIFGLENLNMCSAWTHVCADTMRSTAVLLAAGIAVAIPSIPPAKADAIAAIVVSVIILGSLIRLSQGLAVTAMKAYRLLTHQPPRLPAVSDLETSEDYQSDPLEAEHSACGDGRSSELGTE